MIKLFASIVFLLAFAPKTLLAHETNYPTIHIGPNGFEPNELTISVGDTVLFENVDLVEHWPASDIHPSHGIYPEFDPKRGLAAGDEWSFTFDKAGEWSMHDHLFPEFIGKIIVTGEKSKTDSQKPNFINNFIKNIKITLYKLLPFYSDPKFKKVDMFELAKNQPDLIFWMKVKGSKALMDKLLEQSGGGSSKDCHQEAHIMGRTAFEVFDREAFASGDLSCHSGFYHGAMEGFLKINGTQNLAKNIAQICKGFETQFGTFECLHGVGHGLLAYKNYDLPKALDACNLLTNLYDQSSCYGGVFMENIIIGQNQGIDNEHKTTWLSSDPHFPCNALDKNQTLQYQCYMMQTSRMLFLNSYNYEEAAGDCLEAPSDAVAACFQSLGRDISGNFLRDPKQIVDKCAKMPVAYQKTCITGALYVIVDFWGDKMESYPHELCHMVNSRENKQACFQDLSVRLKDVYGTNTQAIALSCKLMGDYESQCLTSTQ